jgi:hypothetical protein
MMMSGRPKVALKFDGAEEQFQMSTRRNGWKVYIILEFIKKDIATYMSHRLKSGTERIDELNFRSFIIANNLKKFEKYLKIKVNQKSAITEKIERVFITY